MPRPGYSPSIATVIGNRILSLREQRGLSQSELGERLGISYQQVQKYEKGLSVLSVERLFQYARELEVPVATILSNVEEAAEDATIYRAPQEYHVHLTPDEFRMVKLFRKLTRDSMRRHARDYLQTLVRGENLIRDIPSDTDESPDDAEGDENDSRDPGASRPAATDRPR